MIVLFFVSLCPILLAYRLIFLETNKILSVSYSDIVPGLSRSKAKTILFYLEYDTT